MRRATLAALVAAVLAGCPTEREADLPEDAAEAAKDEALRFVIDEELQGLRVELSEAEPGGTGGDGLPAAEAEILSEADTLALLARVPDLEEKDGDRASFAFRERSEPPPRTGATVEVPFPPPSAPPLPDIEDPDVLRVLRHAPEGDVPMAPHLSVTFDQPMLAITSQEEASKVRPLTLEPEPPGQWRWVGTKTILFEPDPRFPMATTYTVTVPKGTLAAKGASLPEEATWTFTTPPPVLQDTWPWDGPHDLDPLFYLGFDQAIDAAAMLPFVEVRGGSHTVPLKLATDAEIERDEIIRTRVQASEEGRYLVVASAEPLRKNTSYTIAVKPGAPSAEGPNTTEGEQSRSFYTYAPLAVDYQDCWWAQGGCSPDGHWSVVFNNPLDADAFDPKTVLVDPEEIRRRSQVAGRVLAVYGRSTPRTKYTVTLPAGLTDAFGQTLGEDQKREFEVGGLWPSLAGPDKDFVVADPSGPPVFPVYSVNHERIRVKVYRGAPEAYAALSTWMREVRYDGFVGKTPPLEKLHDEIMDIPAYVPDEMVETAIDLRPWLDGDHGQLFVWVEQVPQPEERWSQIHVFAWVQVTDIALSAYVDYQDMSAWASNLADGAPLEGVELSLYNHEGSTTTGADGQALVDLYTTSEGPHLLLARKGDDLAILPERAGWWNQYGGWQQSSRGEGLRWYVFDDRHMYRPAETVSVKGWVRRFDNSRNGDISWEAGQPTGLTWSAKDALGNEIAKGKSEVSAGGGFDLSFDLPKTPNLGQATLEIYGEGMSTVSGSYHYHRFQIQEFRRPEFEVGASADPGPYFLGEHAEVTVNAAYYSGGALPGAPVTWDVTSEQATFTPPNRDDYRFGTWVPWWRSWYGGYSSTWTPPDSLSGETDPLGNHHLRIDFVAVNPPRPMTVKAEARVTDVNRQTWTASHSVLMHPSKLYVGVKPSKPYIEQEEQLDLELVVVDIEGEAVADVPIALTFARMDWKKVSGSWQEVEDEPESCAATSDDEPVACAFTPMEGGSYVVRAEVKDAQGRPNETEFRIWVTGGASKPQRSVDMEQVVLVPDKESYRPGDTAEVMIQAPFWPAEGKWSIYRNGRIHEELFTLDGPSKTLNVPIVESHVPNFTLDVDLVGATTRTDDDGKPLPDAEKRPAHAQGQLTLPVPPATRTLAVLVTPADKALSPGGHTEIAVAVTDHDGKPARAEVAVVAVDESVLALSGYQIPDPLDVFYAAVSPGVSEYHLRSSVVLRDPKTVEPDVPEPPEEPMELEGLEMDGRLDDAFGDGEVGGVGGLIGTKGFGGVARSEEGSVTKRESRSRGASPKAKGPAMAPSPSPVVTASPTGEDRGATEVAPIALRSDFSATALFAAHVDTASDGTATVRLDLPDSLTRYRVMVVAVSGDQQFGYGESTVTARLPVMLRPSPPRFLNFGDRMELPLVVQNQTDAPLVVEIAIEATNALVIDDVATVPTGTELRVAGRRMTVPAEDRVEVRIPVAADMAGRARFQAVIATKGFADAAGFDFPVWTPATSEAFATYGEIDDGAVVQPVSAPPDVWTQFGGLQVTTSSTALQALTDAFLYLVQYPFECNEQIASRILSVAALRDVLEAFEADGLPSATELDDAVARDLDRLKVRQHYNGGWSWWKANDVDWPYPTVHVAHAVARAKQQGYPVDEDVVRSMMPYLRDIESHIPHWYSNRSRWTIIAYSIYVRHLLDDSDVVKARGLVAKAGVKGLPLEALGWILPTLNDAGETALVAEIVRHLENNVAETAAGAHFVTSYDDGEYVLLHSDRRVDGVLLEALIEVRPEHDLVPKLVRGLLGHRKAGKWGNTQENALILLAMNEYFTVYESETPDFVARVWLGEKYAGEHTFAGRTTERAAIDIPMGMLTDPGGEQDLVLVKDGVGRMYYRVGMTYAPKDLTFEAADYGFTVLREYEGVDDPRDVTRDGDGTWRIKAGSRVRVRLTMVAPMRRYHVALVDPLPAGLEPMNPALKVTGTIPSDPSEASAGFWWWRGTWYEHQNMRDERVEAYTSLLWDGVHTYTYVANATTPGQFVVPPAKAEEMYHPETFGRSASDRVIVE